jgi:hypothetical protein
VQSDPQAQFSPQRHPARRTFCVLWQPQVQAAPAQDAHEQGFEVVVLFDMTGSFESGRRAVNEEECRTRPEAGY